MTKSGGQLGGGEPGAIGAARTDALDLGPELGEALAALPLAAERYELVTPVATDEIQARDRKTGRPVTLRRVPAAIRSSSDALLRYLSTAKLVAALGHAGIVRVHGCVRDEAGPLMATDPIEGQDLAALVAERGPAPVEVGAGILARVADALATAHATGIVHRNLKPHCIFLDATNEPRLTDFGLGREGEAELLGGDVPVGLRAYMAPEQIDPEQRVDRRTDVFRLAKTLYFLVTGASPSVVEVERVRPEARPILKKALSVRPAERHGSIAELRDELVFIAGLPPLAEVATVVCGYCGVTVAVGTPYCGSCGHKLPETRVARQARRVERWHAPSLREAPTSAIVAPPPLPRDVVAAARAPVVPERPEGGAPGKGEPAPAPAPAPAPPPARPQTESLRDQRLRSVPGRQSPPGDPLAARLDPEPRSEVEHPCSTSEDELKRRGMDRQRAETIAEEWRTVERERAAKGYRRMLAALRLLEQMDGENPKIPALVEEAKKAVARSERHLAGAEEALRKGNLKGARALAETVLLEAGPSPSVDRILQRVEEIGPTVERLRRSIDEAAAAGDRARAAALGSELLELFPEDTATKEALDDALNTEAAARGRRRVVGIFGAAMVALALILGYSYHERGSAERWVTAVRAEIEHGDPARALARIEREGGGSGIATPELAHLRLSAELELKKAEAGRAAKAGRNAESARLYFEAREIAVKLGLPQGIFDDAISEQRRLAEEAGRKD